MTITLFIDIDGVCANWNLAVYKLFNIYPECGTGHRDICDVLNIKKSRLWGKINSSPTFWEDIEPYPWLDELLDIVSEKNGYKTYVCTSTGISCPHAASGKMKWINKYLGGSFTKQFFLTADKHLLAQPGRILIDDNDKQCDNFEKFGGFVCQFPQMWGKNHMNSHRKIEYVKERLEEITASQRG